MLLNIGTVARSVVGLLVLVGCSSESWVLPRHDRNYAAKEQAQTWLAESKRAVAIRINTDLPKQDIRLKGSHSRRGASMGAGQGALSGVGSSLEVAIREDPLSGIILLPFAILGGAAFGALYEPTIEVPVTDRRSLKQTEGGDAVADVAENEASFIELITDEIERRSKSYRQHDLRVANGNADIGTREAVLMVRITTYGFAGNLDDDPDLKIYIAGSSRLWAPNEGSGYSCRWSYGSDHYKMHEWAKNQAALFRAELAKSAEAVASVIIDQVGENLNNCVGTGSLYLKTNSLSGNPITLRQRGEQLIIEGDAAEIYFVGQSFLYRHGDAIEGYRFICHAANRSHGEAQGLMGHMYQRYKDYENPLIPIHKVQAYKWYTLAISNGFQQFTDARDQLAVQMTPTKVTEAERLATEWKPNPARCETIAAQVDY